MRRRRSRRWKGGMDRNGLRVETEQLIAPGELVFHLDQTAGARLVIGRGGKGTHGAGEYRFIA